MKNIVLIIGGFNLPNNNASAIRAVSLARLLSKIGFQPVVAGFASDENNNWFVIDDIRCYNRRDSKTIATDISFVKEIEHIIPSSDIYAIIAYNYPGVALNKLFHYAISNGIKMISDATEWYGWELRERGLIGALVRKYHTEYRMRYLNKRIGNIICSTYYVANYYSGYNTVVLPAIDDQSFDIVKHDNHILPVSGGKHTTRFFYAGSPGYKFRKDKINLVVQMFERLSEENIPFRFDVYGVSLDEYLKFFAAPNTKLKEIVFHGRVSRQIILEQLKQSDFSVLLRPNDQVCKVGFSSKSMESISAGVPLIANDVNGDFSKYFTQNQALLCGADDIDGFYGLLKKACTMTGNEITSMKKSCIKNNPFNYVNYLEPIENFMHSLQ